jgi:hypothetical protein
MRSSSTTGRRQALRGAGAQFGFAQADLGVGQPAQQRINAAGRDTMQGAHPLAVFGHGIGGVAQWEEHMRHILVFAAPRMEPVARAVLRARVG